MEEFRTIQSSRSRKKNRTQNSGEISRSNPEPKIQFQSTSIESTNSSHHNIEKSQKSILLKILFYSKYISKEIKLLVYKTCIRSILTNACPIWYNQPAHNRKIQSLRKENTKSSNLDTQGVKHSIKPIQIPEKQHSVQQSQLYSHRYIYAENN